MIEYVVTTGSMVNSALLHSTMKDAFITDDLEEARKVFNKEVETLEAQYINQANLDYSPSDEEVNHALFCQIVAFSIDEDGEADVIDIIEWSDRYYEQ